MDSSAKPINAPTRVSLAPPRAITGAPCLVTLYGGPLGRKFDLGPGRWLLGRDPDAQIVLASDSVSRNHARITLDEAGSARVADLNSTNGTFVNDVGAAEAAPLRSGDLLRLGDVIFKFLAGEDVEAAYHEAIYKMTIQDGLTGIANKRHLDDFLEREVARAARHNRDLAVLIFDIDHFKRVNDEYGHLTGDDVLRELARRVAVHVRRDELFGRWGGEEFMVVSPEADPLSAAGFAERLRGIAAQAPFLVDGHTIALTISVGFACFAPGLSAEDLVAAADAALYRAKDAGRDRVRGPA